MATKGKTYEPTTYWSDSSSDDDSDSTTPRSFTSAPFPSPSSSPSPFKLGDEVHFEKSKGKGWVHYTQGVISQNLNDNSYVIVDDDDVSHTVHVSNVMTKEQRDELEYKSMNNFPKTMSGQIKWHGNDAQRLTPRRAFTKPAEVHRPVPVPTKKRVADVDVEKLEQTVMRLTGENKRLRSELNGGEEDYKRYEREPTKKIANEIICSAIKNLMVDLTGKETGHNGMISVLEAASMNTTDELVKSGVIGESPISLINWDGRTSELIGRFAKSRFDGKTPYAVHTMSSSDFLKINNGAIHKALWLDFENTFKDEVVATDIQHVFKSGMFASGGIFGLTFSNRNGRFREVHGHVNRLAESNGYKVRCLDVNGVSYDQVTYFYRSMKLFIYEVRVM